MKEKFKKGIPVMISIILGILLGMIIVAILEHFDMLDRIDALFFMFCILAISYFLQILVHEAGHLIFGLATGYQFLSFRIGSIILLKQDHHYTFKRYHVPGTAGQCLLIPPKDENIFRLYHAGGVLMNLIFALVNGLLLCLPFQNIYVIAFLIMNILTAIIVGLMNGIPMNVQGICNDGYNLWMSIKDEKRREALYLQLDINAWIYQNKPIVDYPIQRLDKFMDESMDDAFYASLIDYIAIYKIGKHQFDEAYSYLHHLYMQPQSVTVVKNEITCDYAFVKMIQGASQEEIDTILKPVKKYIQMMEPYTLSKIRLQYLYLCLYDRDVKKKATLFKKKEKYIKHIPATSELTFEMELIEYIQLHYDV